MKSRLSSCFMTAIYLALPSLDIFLVARMVYIASVPDLMSPFVAVALGLVLGVVACALAIADQGNTVVEINVGAFILLVFLVILYPLAANAPATRAARKAKRALSTQQKAPKISSQSGKRDLKRERLRPKPTYTPAGL